MPRAPLIAAAILTSLLAACASSPPPAKPNRASDPAELYLSDDGPTYGQIRNRPAWQYWNLGRPGAR